MIAPALLVLVMQIPTTVGDTVWVGRTIRVPPRLIVRPQSWDLGDLGQVLGPPEVVTTADSARIRYPVAMWFAGSHEITIPGPILVSPEGQSDTLPAQTVRVVVASVLPEGANRMTLEPRGAADTVAQSRISLLPLLLLEALTILVATLTILARRRAARRRRASVTEPVMARWDPESVLASWTTLGERRAALDGWVHVVQAESARAPSALPNALPNEMPSQVPNDVRSAVPPEVADWLAAAERAGFQSHAAVDELDRLLAGVSRIRPRAAKVRPA